MKHKILYVLMIIMMSITVLADAPSAPGNIDNLITGHQLAWIVMLVSGCLTWYSARRFGEKHLYAYSGLIFFISSLTGMYVYKDQLILMFNLVIAIIGFIIGIQYFEETG